MANYWLLKSEPNTYSFDDLVRDGRTEWDGVRNFQARNYLRDQMQEGDGVLFYYSSTKPQAVVGTATVVKAGYADDTAWDPNSGHFDAKSTLEKPIWYMVDIAPDQKFKRPITLEEAKAHPVLANMTLVKSGRLSVQPVTAQEWDIILQLGMEGA